MLRGPGPMLLLFALAVTCLIGWARWVWNRARPHVVNSRVYLVHPSEIEVTSPPPWVRSDVKAEVIRDAGWDAPISILEEDTSERINRAFEFHPWVASARTTLTYPARIEVKLHYRKPAAMVRLELPRGLQLIPIDEQGTRLPAEDFTAEDRAEYPQISDLSNVPVVGQKAADERLVGAARLAALLSDVWHRFGFHVITPADGLRSSEGSAELQIFTRSGVAILWGWPPGSEPQGEIAASEKLARLKQYVQEHGPLDGSSGTHLLDVRKLPSPSRTATRPKKAATG